MLSARPPGRRRRDEARVHARGDWVLDSLGTVEILVAVEDEFGIQLDTEENPKTVGEFADTVEAALEK